MREEGSAGWHRIAPRRDFRFPQSSFWNGGSLLLVESEWLQPAVMVVWDPSWAILAWISSSVDVPGSVFVGAVQSLSPFQLWTSRVLGSREWISLPSGRGIAAYRAVGG